jgi:hypothetical protein
MRRLIVSAPRNPGIILVNQIVIAVVTFFIGGKLCIEK